MVMRLEVYTRSEVCAAEKTGVGSRNAGWLRRPEDPFRLILTFGPLFILFSGEGASAKKTLLFNLLYISDNIRQVFQ